jgi:hypothetical protein
MSQETLFAGALERTLTNAIRNQQSTIRNFGVALAPCHGICAVIGFHPVLVVGPLYERRLFALDLLMIRSLYLLVILLLAACGTAKAATNVFADNAPSFPAQCAALAQTAERQNTMTVSGLDGWLFLASELRHLGVGQFWGAAAPQVSRSTNPANADPIPAIADFQDQLAQIGIELLVVPVPPKAVIYPDSLVENIPRDPMGRPVRLDPALQAFYGQLRFKGIRVLDLTPIFLKNRSNPEGALYCKQDSHWSGAGIALAATEIGLELFATFDGRPKQAFTGAWETVEIKGDLWKALAQPEIPREQVRVRRISRPDATTPIATDRDSPVVLLGDSHCLIFHAGDDMQAKGAGLPDQLARELGFPVDLVAVRGSGATPARINLLRRAQNNPQYWAGKKWVIWCFAAREFTESDGWRKAPVK